MDSFGTTLKREREERGLTLDTVAALIHIDRGSLEALERDEHDGLPDHDAMIEGLRNYAECLQVDAELMIEHYERERRACLEQLAERLERSAATARRHASPRTVPPALTAAVCMFALLGLGAWLILGKDTSSAPNLEPAATPVEAAPVDPATTDPAPPRPEAKAATPRPRETRALETTAATPVGGMSVPEYGVGTGVKRRALVGRRDRFAEGSQAWFWTRVEGGTAGDRIEHVWLHEGTEAARVELRIGGARWRTQSAKTLRSSGNWAVEARDASGRLLARTEFRCTP